MKKSENSFFLFLLALLAAFSFADAQWEPNCAGDRRVIVHLFEWRWDDIARECEDFLGPKGYCGVQISPPSENVVIFNESSIKRPWWERYQPVSYKTYTRSGDEASFNEMVRRCNDVGVRIYADLVMNHMCYEGMGQGIGVGGSSYDSEALNFPQVPYTTRNFNSNKTCPTESGHIEDYQDPIQVRNCRLFGNIDLNQNNGWVQAKLADWTTKLIHAGVAGFRFDASKHMWPKDMEIILTSMEHLSQKWFPPRTRPFVYQEVVDYGNEAIKSSEYFFLGRVTEFNYGKYVTEAFRGITKLNNLRTLGQGFGYLMPDRNAFIFIDNHYTQRGMGDDPGVATFWDSRLYKMCVTYMLAWPYGVPRVMSSYWWPRKIINGKDVNALVGPPSDVRYNIKHVFINPNGSCGNGWICEHRWPEIHQMVKFRNVVGNESVENWWDDGDRQIAFSRGKRAFYAVNASPVKNLDVSIFTGLPEGRYCDVISGDISDDKRSCSGSSVTVGSDGKSKFVISFSAEDPMIAIHVESKLNFN